MKNEKLKGNRNAAKDYTAKGETAKPKVGGTFAKAPSPDAVKKEWKKLEPRVKKVDAMFGAHFTDLAHAQNSQMRATSTSARLTFEAGKERYPGQSISASYADAAETKRRVDSYAKITAERAKKSYAAVEAESAKVMKEAVPFLKMSESFQKHHKMDKKAFERFLSPKSSK